MANQFDTIRKFLQASNMAERGGFELRLGLDYYQLVRFHSSQGSVSHGHFSRITQVIKYLEKER